MDSRPEVRADKDMTRSISNLFSLEQLVEVLAQPDPVRMPDGWQHWDAAAQAHRVLMRREIHAMPRYPQGFAGRGIVICCGGPGLFTCGYVCARMLRFVGCRLPIQFWHLGDREMDEPMRRLAADVGAACIDAERIRVDHPARILNGWELKPYALRHSPFKEVLLLDADNVPVVDPTFLFETNEFRKRGTVFWPDYSRLAPDRTIWSICDVTYRDEPEIESGQILIDKERCWAPLLLTQWMNEHSDYFYAHIHGDKGTYQMAWHMLDQPYGMPSTPIEALDATMCQHDFNGRRVFQHRNMDKWRLDGSNRRVNGFLYEDQCREVINDLRAAWSGVIGPSVPNDDDYARALNNTIVEEMRAGVFEPHPSFATFRGPLGLQRQEEAEWFTEKYRTVWAVGRTIRPRSMIELGVLDGRSADAFLAANPTMSYVGIDRWRYDQDPGWDGEAWVRRIFAERGYANVQLIRSDFRSLTQLPEAALVHVDGSHDYHNERRDLDLALTARPRWLFVDDYRGDEGELAATTDFCDVWGHCIRATVTLDYCHGGGLLIALNELAAGDLQRLERARAVEEALAGAILEYRRIGFDQRPLELRRGGVVGDGAADCERSWRIDLDQAGVPTLTIAGHRGATCRLRRDGASGRWKGRWLHHERMRIELVPPAAT